MGTPGIPKTKGTHSARLTNSHELKLFITMYNKIWPAPVVDNKKGALGRAMMKADADVPGAFGTAIS